MCNILLKKLPFYLKVFVKIKQLDTGYEWFWTRQNFINRKYRMLEMYEDFEEGESWDVPPERDPFLESPETECLIGTVEVYLTCIAYQVNIDDHYYYYYSSTDGYPIELNVVIS